MYKLLSYILLLIALPSVESYAAEKLTMNEQTGVVEDNTREKLKTVKDLFTSKKDSVPKVPNIISNKPEMVDLETGEPEVISNTDEQNLEAPSAEQAPNENAANTNSNSKVVSSSENDKIMQMNSGKSIMFDEQKIQSMMRVFSAYLESQAGKENDSNDNSVDKKSLEELQKELLAKLKPEDFVKSDSEIITIRLPAYIKLDSIIYRSPTNKRAWVNSKKYQDSDGNDELTMKTIQKDFVILSLSLKDTKTDLIDLQNRIDKAGSSSITIDESKPALLFRLALNQYLDVAAMRILEGDFNPESYDLGSSLSLYYDPKKPEDRFVSLDETKKAEEKAESIDTQEPQDMPNINQGEAIEAIDAPIRPRRLKQ